MHRSDQTSEQMGQATRRGGWHGPWLGLAIGSLVLFFPMVASGAVVSKPHITHVRVTGAVTKGRYINPTITITGTGFGHRPQTACMALPHGGTGCNYGDALWFWDLGRTGAGGPGGFRAGRVGPAGNIYETDSIGLLLQTYTPTRIVFRLGSRYNNEPGYHWSIQRHDHYEVKVNGATFTGMVGP